MTVGFAQKAMFFDRQAVIDAVGRANARNLLRAGSFIRRSARSSLRRRKRISAPGEPPSVHAQDRTATLKNIWFVFERRRASVVVGPLRLGSRAPRDSNRATIPELLELGGSAVLERRRPERRRRVAYAPRPFMGPALRRELPKFQGLWADSVK
ncbi:MAG TPA: hypothetical protein DCQ98_13310 [Planctomycetaceae bacterium]|nr:hypothetical protein [Planctomycetaceae bacterium]HRF02441.1 hypothetical protein [Pirellulaceae bacterium]